MSNRTITRTSIQVMDTNGKYTWATLHTSYKGILFLRKVNQWVVLPEDK